VLTATNRLLHDQVKAGTFRQDLYYRVNVIRLSLPPLRDRREDIPLLFLRMVREATLRHGVPERRPGPDALADLAARDWPGNLRQLRNTADRLVLGLDDPPETIAPQAPRLADRMERYERSVIAGVIAAQGGHLRRVQEYLGVSRKTLYDKMRKHGLDRRLIMGGDEVD
jgi:two-component system C4-dicarboxylate transport response regulator DctD